MMKHDDGNQEGQFNQGNDNEPDLVLKMRGLPWSCTLDDICEFFGGPSESGIRNGNEGIHLIQTPEGRASGEAFVEFNSEEDLTAGLGKDRNSMGHRYIEVFEVKRAEMDWILRRNRPYSECDSPLPGPGGECECFIRMRGLPYECGKDDIIQFFEGLEIVPNGIHILDERSGRSSGEAYCQFVSKEVTEQALLRDRQSIGHRYIELFRIGVAEMRSLDMFVPRNNRPFSNNRPGPYDRERPPMHSNGNGRGGRYGNQQRGGRYYSKGFEEDTWNSYANEVGSWTRGGGGGNNGGHAPPPPPPLPLIPGLKRMGGGQGGGGGGGSSGYCVLMRGLPYRATDDDIQAFFDPLVPRGIRIIYDDSNRPSGTAKVLFASQDDVNLAMGKNKNRMEHRYIELFISSP